MRTRYPAGPSLAGYATRQREIKSSKGPGEKVLWPENYLPPVNPDLVRPFIVEYLSQDYEM
ncbi:MAG TPA: hypothetical protein VG204_07035 [Terriglobia bacterium]|nr:hypothetical protein [Terriglobia bacterium]